MVEETPVAAPDQATEYMLMSLRLAEGADLARYAQLAGVSLDPVRIDALEAQGLLSRAQGRIAATARGRIVLNRVLAELLA
jgi:oxygen-independent coproporphyrinogen-3 oxidase